MHPVPTLRYEALAGELATLIERGVLRPGERLPSTRLLARDHRVSIATATQALHRLEDRGLVQARPRSGYYVNARREAPVPAASRPPTRAAEPDVSALVFEVFARLRRREVVPLGSAFPSPLLFPLDKLAQRLGKAARRMDPWKTVEDLSPGSPELRRQVARRQSAHGVPTLPDDVVVTSGAMEALNLCLQAVTRPGEVVAIESPAFYGALQAIERLGLRAVEVATDPAEGVDLGQLERAIRRHRVKACWLMTTFQNPLGATLPEAKKCELVRLLAAHEVPLIEDDVYAELYFGTQRPLPAKAFDAKGLVLHCGSFSKSLAPGYRLGWCAPGRWREAVERAKLTTSIATTIPVQEAIADYLRDGGYDRHLRALRRRLQAQQLEMARAVADRFPAGTRVARPEGGYFLWVELPAGNDALAIHRRALQRGVSVAPGPIFSPTRGFAHCLRLNSGHPFEGAVDEAVGVLARLARA
jgi:DNA-binding transcriptional MocR family regulator